MFTTIFAVFVSCFSKVITENLPMNTKHGQRITTILFYNGFCVKKIFTFFLLEMLPKVSVLGKEQLVSVGVAKVAKVVVLPQVFKQLLVVDKSIRKVA